MTSGQGPPPEPVRDEDLMRRLRGGDEQALESLVERHRGLLVDHVKTRLPAAILRKVSVADVLQDVRWVIYRRRADFEDRGPGSARAWLARIADLRAQEVARHFGGRAKRSVWREVSQGSGEATPEARATRTSPSQGAIAAEDAARVRRAVATLSADHREVLRLAQEEGLTLGMAGERMGRSREAAKKLYARALAQLAEALRAPEDAGR